jgi:sugar phosphate isomerase/epimerase
LVTDRRSVTRAWQQIVDLLQRIDEIAGDCGIIIVIEPLNKRESDMINRPYEAMDL